MTMASGGGGGAGRGDGPEKQWGGRRRPGGGGAHPEHESVISAVRGGQNRRESTPGGGGRDRGGTAGIEDAADLLVRFDPTGEYRSDGGVLDTETAMEELGREKSSVDPEN